MNGDTYFFDLFPVYPPLFGTPAGHGLRFGASWAVRMAVVACPGGLVWIALRASRDVAAGSDVPSQLAVQGPPA